MATNLGLTEEFNSEIKLTNNKFSLSEQESQKWSALSKRKLDHARQSLGGEESNQSQISSNEEFSSLLAAEHFLAPDKTNSVFSSQVSSAGLRSIQQASRGLETALEPGENLDLSQADVLNVHQNSRSGFGLETGKFNLLVSDVRQADADANSPDVIRNVSKSGDNTIDSLFRDYKWGGSKITYSFFDDAQGWPYYSSSYESVREITGKMKNYLRNILENVIEPLINVDFVEMEDTKNNYGQIRYLFSTTPSVASTTRVSGSSATAGDVKFNPQYTPGFEQGPGAYRYETLIHETLHALGLKHPGNYNGSSTGGQDGPFLPDNLDHSGNTVLSYNRFSHDTPHNGVITPMTHDIKALQYLYGAKEHEAGDTIYKFESVSGYTIGGNFFGSRTQNIKQTIWDSAGTDLYDFSGLAFNQSGYRLDLTDGGWITTQDAYQAVSYKARGNNKTYKATAFGTKTAFNMMIENVVHSSSSDLILLNQVANTISGYKAGSQAGDDIVVNANGEDTLDLSSYKSSDVTKTISGHDLVLTLGGDGSITIKDYLTAGVDNQIKILLNGTTPGPVDPPVTPPVTPNTILGTNGDDNLNGTPEVDLIKGHEGGDMIKGHQGNDDLRGGHGNDTLKGGIGADTIKGGHGNDVIVGGAGHDMLTGGDGKDTFVYQANEDRRDTITDFEIANDRLDLQQLFSGNNYTSVNPFNDYVQLVQESSSTKVKIDTLGDTGDKFKTFALLNNVKATDLTADHFTV